jgi:hypothetical protein
MSKTSLYVDYFNGQLHGRDGIQRGGRLTDLFAIQKVKMVQASATYKYLGSILLAAFRLSIHSLIVHVF